MKFLPITLFLLLVANIFPIQAQKNDEVFGISLFSIAATGMFMIKKGKFSFKERGWKLAIAGMIFPMIFFLFLS